MTALNFYALFLLIAFLYKKPAYAQIEHPCDSEIYCTGELLKTVQMARIFPDSKTFVDMSIREGNTPVTVLEAFNNLPNRTRVVLRNFVHEYFVNGDEFEPWTPKDWIPDPKFLGGVADRDLFRWGLVLNLYWNQLGRKIKEEVKRDPERFSIIYVSNGIIVPGGRFREFYYWDSYWIQIGLLHCEMTKTVKGMIDNFLEIIENDEYGFVPNGGRIYYRRSQPPLLIPMVRNYIENQIGPNPGKTKDYLKSILPILDKEFKWWMDNRLINVIDANQNSYRLAIYNSTKNEPRPESFREDHELGDHLEESDKIQMYTDLHSGAESGWDFSSRWWSVEPGEPGTLSDIRTTNVVPVDLNAYLYLNAMLMNKFYNQMENKEKAREYSIIGDELRRGIMNLLWDEELGCWFDYDRTTGNRRKDFYLSNIVPLWAGVDTSKVDQVLRYIEQVGALKYQGGVPTSLKQTGEQWDYPNGWAPLQHLLIDAFERTNNPKAKEVAFDVAQKWITGNYKYYEKKRVMAEKYDVTSPGAVGGGGEYEVVLGFGWTNGVVLDLLNRYGDRLKAEAVNTGQTNPSSSAPRGSSTVSPLGSILIVTSSLTILILSYFGALFLVRRCSWETGDGCKETPTVTNFTSKWIPGEGTVNSGIETNDTAQASHPDTSFHYKSHPSSSLRKDGTIRNGLTRVDTQTISLLP